MKWVRLVFSVALFPLSLAWYRTDVGPRGVSRTLYWSIMGIYVAANIAILVYALNNVSFDLPLDV